MIKRVLKDSESIMALMTSPENDCAVVNKKEVCGQMHHVMVKVESSEVEIESHTHNCIVTAPPLCLYIGDRGRG